MLSYIKTLVLVLSLGCVFGCSTQSQIQNERPPLVLPKSPEVKMRPVKWEIKNSMICLSPEQYSNLSLNTDDIKNFIIIQNKIIEMYKDYYKNDINNKNSKQFLKEDLK